MTDGRALVPAADGLRAGVLDLAIGLFRREKAMSDVWIV